MQTERIHLHSRDGDILCGSGAHDGGLLLLSTHLPAMTTCGPCLNATVFSPITVEEFTALTTRARGILTRAMLPLDLWLAERDREAEARHRALVELEELHAATPWWHVRQRWFIRRVIADYLPTA